MPEPEETNGNGHTDHEGDVDADDLWTDDTWNDEGLQDGGNGDYDDD